MEGPDVRECNISHLGQPAAEVVDASSQLVDQRWRSGDGARDSNGSAAAEVFLTLHFLFQDLTQYQE